MAKKTNSTALTASMQDLRSQLQQMIDNKVVPANIKNVETAMAIAAYGETLNMSPAVALNSIEMLLGTPSIKSKVIPGLLSRRNISLNLIKDCEPIYEEKLAPVVKYTQNQTTGAVEPVMINGKPAYELNEDGSLKMVPTKQIVDYETVVEIVREYPGLGVQRNRAGFKLSMARDAGWLDKPNWKQNKVYMMSARAITRAARFFASDIIGSLYDEHEQRDINNIEYTIDDEGQIYEQ